MRPATLATLARTWMARARDHAAETIARIGLGKAPKAAFVIASPTGLQSALLISLSHDLRTPLACILGSATTLDDFGEVLDREAHSDLVRVIREEAERLNRFLGNLLDMTRLDAGVIEPRLRPVDLACLVADTVDRASRTLVDHHVVLQVPPRLVRVGLDPVLFEQLLFNILDNAAMYAPAGSEIRIRAWRDEDRVRLAISDEGCGIAPADLDRVFDRFYRARPSDRQRAGTGLGLAVCQGLVEAMGGTIAAGNRKDRRGAVFTMILPLAGDESAFANTRGPAND